MDTGRAKRFASPLATTGEGRDARVAAAGCRTSAPKKFGCLWDGRIVFVRFPSQVCCQKVCL